MSKKITTPAKLLMIMTDALADVEETRIEIFNLSVRLRKVRMDPEAVAKIADRLRELSK